MCIRDRFFNNRINLIVDAIQSLPFMKELQELLTQRAQWQEEVRFNQCPKKLSDVPTAIGQDPFVSGVLFTRAPSLGQEEFMRQADDVVAQNLSGFFEINFSSLILANNLAPGFDQEIIDQWEEQDRLFGQKMGVVQVNGQFYLVRKVSYSDRVVSSASEARERDQTDGWRLDVYSSFDQQEYLGKYHQRLKAITEIVQ